MPTILFRFLVFLVFVASTFVLTNAQDGQEPDGRIIEIKVADSLPLVKIPLRSDQHTGFWTPLVPRIKDWQPPVGQEITQAVSFSAILIGDKAELKIAVRAKKSELTEKAVTSYSMSVGDEIAATELRNFGYEPIIAKMKKVVLSPAGVLMVDNYTKSIHVNQPIAKSGAISFQFTNDSKKPVLAVVWRIHQAGYALLYSQTLDEHGKVLMEPGAKHDVTARADKADSVYGGVTLVVESVIFEDGTFEGNSGPAELFRFAQVGRRMALEQLLPILRNMQKSEVVIDIGSTIGRIEALREKDTNENNSFVVSSYNALIMGTVSHFRRLQSTQSNETNATVSRSLVELTDLYQQWFDRLSRFQR